MVDLGDVVTRRVLELFRQSPQGRALLEQRERDILARRRSAVAELKDVRVELEEVGTAAGAKVATAREAVTTAEQAWRAAREALFAAEAAYFGATASLERRIFVLEQELAASCPDALSEAIVSMQRAYQDAQQSAPTRPDVVGRDVLGRVAYDDRPLRAARTQLDRIREAQRQLAALRFEALDPPALAKRLQAIRRTVDTIDD